MRQVTRPADLPAARQSLMSVFDPVLTGAALREAGGSDQQAAAAVDISEETFRALSMAELYWVTAPMTELALDAALDIPDWTAGSARPSGAGLVWWAGQLPEVERMPYVGEPAYGRTLHGGVWVHPTALAWFTSPADPAMLQLVLFAPGPIIDPTTEAALLPLWTTDIALTGPPRPDHDAAESAGVIALLGATWHLMLEPKVAVTATVAQHRKDRQRAQRRGLSTADITTVDLRTVRRVDSDSATEPARPHLSVRHMVRGHWRQQWMASTGTHEPRYIAPYVKGPAGAPLKVRERVMVWRR